MPEGTKLIIAVPPELAEEASRPDCVLAHMIYRVGRGFRLFRAQRTQDIRGGLMVIDTGPFSGGGPISALVCDITDECERCGFTGIVIDAGDDPGSPSQLSLARSIARAAGLRGLRLFVPEALAGAGENATVLIPTALSGGSLGRYLNDMLEKYSGRAALEIERVRMDFCLPATTGRGKELTPDEVRALLDKHTGMPFFSTELAANYFSYRDKKGMHFVLYDNAASIRHKLRAGMSLGIKSAFLYYPHITDIYDKIIAP